MSWQILESDNPELAEFGKGRFASRVAYLATVRKNGSPRVHPVTPIFADGDLFVFMDIRSPKGYDLKRSGRFALHSSVEDEEGGHGEFFISGRSELVEDQEIRTAAALGAVYEIQDSYILFLFIPVEALGTVY
jgi:hypothetical protein